MHIECRASIGIAVLASFIGKARTRPRPADFVDAVGDRLPRLLPKAATWAVAVAKAATVALIGTQAAELAPSLSGVFPAERIHRGNQPSYSTQPPGILPTLRHPAGSSHVARES
ncbi:hypothetical protein ACWIG3_23985 [Streptomyces celluloflavus]